MNAQTPARVARKQRRRAMVADLNRKLRNEDLLEQAELRGWDAPNRSERRAMRPARATNRVVTLRANRSDARPDRSMRARRVRAARRAVRLARRVA